MRTERTYHSFTVVLERMEAEDADGSPFVVVYTQSKTVDDAVADARKAYLLSIEDSRVVVVFHGWHDDVWGRKEIRRG